MFVMSWRYFLDERVWLPGDCSTPLVFVPYLIVTRQWRAASNAALTFVVATGTMTALAPRSSWNYFTNYAFDVQRVGDTVITNNQTLRAALARAGLAQSHAPGDLLLVVVLCAGMTLAAVAFYRSSELLGVLLCAATGLLVSPISWQHHYVWCVPLLVWLVFGVDRPRRRAVWAAIAALVFMVMPPGHSGGLNVLWYLRENAYVLVTVGFMALAGAMLWTRSRTSTAGEGRALTAIPQ
jgi:alpha-1,2-mannosyltransferase